VSGTKANPKNSPRRLAVSKDRIIRDLRRIGVRKGDHIAVTLSLKSIGHVDGGPTTFIDAMLETLGSNGTLLMNTFTRTFPLSMIPSDFISDRRTTPVWTGLVPETLRKRKDSTRSPHPSFSVTAIGKLAQHLTKDHNENSNLFMPYSRLAEAGGKYLCIGLGNRLVAIRHEAQRLAGLFNLVHQWRGVKYKDFEGKVMIYIYNSLPCIRKLPELVPTLEKTGIVKTGKVGMARSVLAPAKELLQAMAEMLERDPTLNLCDDILCLWCREAERTLDIYRKIENPKFFQRNPLLVRIIALMNDFRLNKYRFLSFQNGKDDWNGHASASKTSGRRILKLLARIGWLNYLTLRRFFNLTRTKHELIARSRTIPLTSVSRERPTITKKS
jgi:aminoglycoside 3-N-acetyltransferase